LLKTIAGLLPVDAGQLVGKDEGDPNPRTALLLQEPDNQFVASSVRNELLLSLPPEMSREDRDKRLSRAVEQFSLGEFLDRNPHRLSGGEKQRVAFATVWLSDPRLLLLDEPTSYLDNVQSERCLRFVEDLNKTGVSVVWATPFVNGLPNGRRLVYIDDGRLRFDGAAGSFDVVGAGIDRPTVQVEQAPRRTGPPDDGTAPSVVVMRSVSFTYDQRPLFEEFSMDLREGEFVAISGRNGSGKSTLLGLLSGVHKPTAGELVRLYEKAVGSGQQNTFYLFQNPERLFFAETAYEEIAFGLKALKIPKSEVSDRVASALTRVGLAPANFEGRMPFSLSFGEMRRLAFAIALALEPRFLLLDEPGSCLDPSGYSILYDLLHHFKDKRCTVALASHDVDMFAHVIDRVIEL
jgi:energy-coupling factor transport system ATP-binding protein